MSGCLKLARDSVLITWHVEQGTLRHDLDSETALHLPDAWHQHVRPPS